MLTFTAPIADSPIADAPFGHVDGARTWPCAIGGHGYVLDHAKSQIKTVPALRQAQDVGTEPGGRSLSIEASWKRTRSSWVGGAGQVYADDATSDPTRFLLSANLDVWAADGPTLRPSVVKLSSSSNTQHENVAVFTYGVGLIWGSSNVGTLQTYEYGGLWDSTNTKVRSVKVTSAFDTCAGLAFDAANDFVYASFKSGGIWRAADTNADAFGTALTSPSWSQWSTTATGRIAICKGFFLAAGNPYNMTTIGNLYTVDSSGAATLLYTHPASADWVGFVEAANGIYAGAQAQSSVIPRRGEVFFIGIDSTTGGLKTPVLVAQLPDGEALHTLISYGGFLILGTSEGVRVARINNDDTITYGSAISPAAFMADAADQDKSVHTLAAYKDRVYFGINSVRLPGMAHPRTGIGVLNLARSTDPESLVPAWTIDSVAPDMGAATAGLVSVLVIGIVDASVSDSWGIYWYNSSDWWASQSWYDQGDLVDEGWLEQGWFAFDSTEPKQFLSLDVRANLGDAAFASTGGVEAWLEVDDRHIPGSTSDAKYPDLHLGAFGYDATGSADPWGIGLVAERVCPLVRIRGNGKSGYRVEAQSLRDLTIRAVPAPERVDELVLALILKRTVETPAGVLKGVDCAGEYAWIKSLESSQAVVRCALGSRTFYARVADVQFDATGWDDTTDWFEGVCSVRLVTTEAAA